MLPGGLDLPAVGAHSVRVCGVPIQQAGQADHGIERRAHFVAHVKEEEPLGFIGCLGRLIGILQRGMAALLPRFQLRYILDGHQDRYRDAPLPLQAQDGDLPPLGAAAADVFFILQIGHILC